MRDVRLTELQGIHVLVIDDDLRARHYLRAVLELCGATVTATSAADVARVALVPDVIVCDHISAENANGEILEWLRHIHVRQGRRVPAVALLQRGMKDAHGRAPDFERYLTKPVDADDLRAAVISLVHS